MTDIDLNDPASIDDPHSYWSRYRDMGPVQWSDAHRAWVVLGHVELSEAFRDGRLLSADRVTPLERVAAHRPSSFAKVVELLGGWMVFRDPPLHTHLRDPMRNVFTPRRVATLEEMVSQVVDEIVDGLDDVIDVREDFAGPLPAWVIAAVLGVEATERDRFQGWSNDLATIVFATDPHTTAPEQATAAAAEFSDFFQRLIERERAEPSETLMTALVNGAGDQLSDLELVGACTLILFAGHETTTSLLMNTMGLLATRRDLVEALRVGELDTALEELLRVLGPTRSMYRKVAVAHERGGQALAVDDNVLLCVAAANHDPDVFDEPGRLKLDRDPNPHLTFGWGLHHCLGAHLARLEARLALKALLGRYRTFEPVGPVPPIEGTVISSIQQPLRVKLS
ncbi:MAG: cytochrome P450 [Actinomycetota bacterium]|nr:cytochrome P450 [Acidimicrobiales bacterium]MED5542417.1 cytochrome P450 [Actinomycetota bacterium]